MNDHVKTFNDLWPFLNSHYKNFIGSTTTFQHQFRCLLFFVTLDHGSLIPFLVPTFLPVHISLGACCAPVSLNRPARIFFPSSVTDFHSNYFYSSALTPNEWSYTFLYSIRIDAYIRKFVSIFIHSHHRYFMGTRPIGHTSHLWDTFVVFTLRCLSADFRELSDTLTFVYICQSQS